MKFTTEMLEKKLVKTIEEVEDNQRLKTEQESFQRFETKKKERKKGERNKNLLGKANLKYSTLFLVTFCYFLILLYLMGKQKSEEKRLNNYSLL